MNILLIGGRNATPHAGDRVDLDRLAESLSQLGFRVQALQLPDDQGIFDRNELAFVPQIVHVIHATRGGIPVLDYVRRNRIRLITTCTGTDAYVDLSSPGLNQKVADVLAESEMVVIPYPAMGKAIQNRLPGCTRFTVIQPSVRLPKVPVEMPPEMEAFLKQHRVVLLPGGISPVKNNLFAVRAFERLVQGSPDIRLAVVGPIFDPDYGRSFMDMQTRSFWVYFLPAQPRELLVEWMRRSELILNVAHVEGSASITLESMALGKPVLASEIPGNRACILDENTNPGHGTGYLYLTSPSPQGYQRIHDYDDFSEQLELILKNPGKAREVGERGRAWVEKTVNPDQEAKAYADMYRQLG